MQLPAQLKVKLLEGIVEGDETYFDYSEKGSKSLTRKPRKRGKKKAIIEQLTGNIKQKVCSVVMVIDPIPSLHRIMDTSDNLNKNNRLQIQQHLIGT